MARRLLAPLGAALALALLPSTALAAPSVTGTFDLPNMPKYLAQGPDGNIWITYGGPEISRVTPAGQVTNFNPANVESMTGVTAANGKIWTTSSNQIGSFSPSDPVGTGDKDDVPGVSGEAITRGSDGNLWTTGPEQVVKLNPGTNPVTPTPIPVAGLNGRDIDAANGLVWVADASGRVIRLTTAGVPTPFNVGGMVQGVAAGPGTDAGFTNQAPPQHVGRIQGGVIKKTPREGDPFGMALGADGAYWAALFNSNPFSLGRLTTGGAITTLGTLAGGPRQITAGPGNTLWVGLEQVNKVARISGVTPAPPGGGGGAGGGTGSAINGTAGNDVLYGTAGNDVINCGAGDDVVNGGGGNDVINCGSGRDRIRGGTGNDLIDAGSDNDRASGDSGRDRIDGNTGNDRVIGNTNGDRLRGGSGNDRIGGSSGNDRVIGDRGNDHLGGDSGNDRISGGRGNDRVSGGRGNDRLAGDSGRDRLAGDSGRDRLSGGSGNDRLLGGRGRDRLLGGSGRDRETQ
jgi:Ca2+-binding RTX toxin-like protein